MTYERETGSSGTAAYLTKKAREFRCLIRKLKWEGRNGAPDYVVIFPDGRLFFIEMKAPGKKPDPHQLREHARLMGYGQRVYTLDSKSAVDAFFADHRHEK